MRTASRLVTCLSCALLVVFALGTSVAQELDAIANDNFLPARIRGALRWRRADIKMGRRMLVLEFLESIRSLTSTVITLLMDLTRMEIPIATGISIRSAIHRS